MKKITLPDLAYEIMEKDKADLLIITYRGITILSGTPSEIYWSACAVLFAKAIKYSNRTYTIDIEIDEE